MMVPHMEKMYMVDEDDATPCLHHEEEVGHMEATTTTTPTSHERENKGIDIGVCDAMIPLVDMMSDCLHAMDATFDIAYESFTFPCDTLPLHHVDHEDLIDCNDIAIGMPCYECFTFSPIACNMLTNCSFPCVASNDENDTMNMLCPTCLNYSPIVASKMLNNCSFQCLVCNNVCMLANEIAPIAFSNFGEFSHLEHVPISCLHFHHAYYNNLLDANGDVQIRRRIMMDDVFIYHAHTYFLLSMMCVGTRNPMSTSIEHELTKRALESIIQVSSRSNPALIPFPCFASNMPNNFSFLWFACKHDGYIAFPCDNHVPMIFDIDALCVATQLLNNFSFSYIVCNHNAILGMLCHECCENSLLLVATNIMKTCSFRWFVCTNDDVLVISPHVFLPNSPLIASRMLNTFSFRCFECNNEQVFRNEMDNMVFSNFGVFVFSHLENAQRACLHNDLAYALSL